MSKPFKRYLVTSALPYANGPVHIGHLAGVYIPSDIYTRYLRLKGYDVISVCGSDEHGVPITIKARKEGVTPQQIVDRYHQLIKSSFEGLGMSFDIYSRTSLMLIAWVPLCAHRRSLRRFPASADRRCPGRCSSARRSRG